MSANEDVSNNHFFSIMLKLLLAFCSLLIVVLVIQTVFSTYMSSNAIIEKVKIHFYDRANDTSALIDSKLDGLMQFLSGVALENELQRTDTSGKDKTTFLTILTKENDSVARHRLQELNFISTNGTSVP